MTGGCQGCAASALTIAAGVKRKLREHYPDLERVIDETDHSAGLTPFFSTEGQTPFIKRKEKPRASE